MKRLKMEPIYKELYKNSVYDVDAFGNPKISRITERMLVSAENHSELLNWGHDYLQSEHNVTMVLIKNHVKILNKILLNEDIELTTWALPRVYPIITRNFVAKKMPENEPIWEATVECVLMDLTSRTIANGDKMNLALPDPFDDFPEVSSKCYRFSRKDRSEALESEPYKIFETIVKYSDLDYNGHLNSARYVEFVEDALGTEFFKDYGLSQMDVQYNAEIKPDEKVKIFVYKKADGFYIIGKVDETINFEAYACVK